MLKALLRTFVDGHIYNDEKVVTSKKHAQFKTQECKNHTLFETTMAKIDTLFLTKTATKPYHLLLHIPIQPI